MAKQKHKPMAAGVKPVLEMFQTLQPPEQLKTGLRKWIDQCVAAAGAQYLQLHLTRWPDQTLTLGRSRTRTADVVVVDLYLALTPDGHPTHQQRGYELGPDGFITGEIECIEALRKEAA